MRFKFNYKSFFFTYQNFQGLSTAHQIKPDFLSWISKGRYNLPQVSFYSFLHCLQCTIHIRSFNVSNIVQSFMHELLMNHEGSLLECSSFPLTPSFLSNVPTIPSILQPCSHLPSASPFASYFVTTFTIII